MAWEIEYTDEFGLWFDLLDEDQQIAVWDRVKLLEHDGPNLRRPYVGTIVTSRHNGMKELVCNQQGSLRVLFIFDPRRMAILLLGGDKTGEWREWYEENIPRADAIYEEYLAELRAAGILE